MFQSFTRVRLPHVGYCHYHKDLNLLKDRHSFTDRYSQLGYRISGGCKCCIKMGLTLYTAAFNRVTQAPYVFFACDRPSACQRILWRQSRHSQLSYRHSNAFIKCLISRYRVSECITPTTSKYLLGSNTQNQTTQINCSYSIWRERLISALSKKTDTNSERASLFY